MRVRVDYVVDVTDGLRRAMRSYYGQSGMASREEVKEWYRLWGRTMDDDLRDPHDSKKGDRHAAK